MNDAAPPRGCGRRLLRAALVAGAALLLALLLGYAWLTDPIDDSPILGTPLAQETEERLAAALTARPPPTQGRLRVGWASAPITPPLGAATYGYGARRGRGVELIADQVHAKAIAVAAGDGPPVVFLTADICLWVSSLSERVANALADRLPRERLYFNATHDHSGPGGYADGPAAGWIMGAPDPALRTLIADGAVAAVRGALDDLAPGAYRELSVEVPELVRNRIRGEVPIDEELLLVEWTQDDGDRCAQVVYAAHATAIGPDALVCSGDYPGALCRALEAAGYDQAAFFAGPTGQAGPGRPTGNLAKEAIPHPGVSRAYHLGKALAERVLELSRSSPAPPRRELTLEALRVPVTLPRYRWRQLGRQIDGDVAATLIGTPRGVAAIHGVRLNETVWLGHSFEFSAVLTRKLKARRRSQGGRLVVTSFNGDHNLYVIPPEDFGHGYEAGMTLYGPGLAPYLERLSELADDGLREPRSAAGERGTEGG
jgi:hypothetical protein